MGAWGHKNFENDEAMDWAAEVWESKGFGLVAEALDTVIAGKNEYLESPECTEALAAAEILAAAGGAPPSDLPPELKAWLPQQEKPGAALFAKAIEAITAVRGEKSELRELWEDSEHYADWNAVMDDLKKRLDAAKTGAGGA